ncbi:MAG: hypothetical protein WCD43_09215, partial [Candidatus Acidiferrales bacterium]
DSACAAGTRASSFGPGGSGVIGINGSAKNTDGSRADALVSPAPSYSSGINGARKRTGYSGRGRQDPCGSKHNPGFAGTAGAPNGADG